MVFKTIDSMVQDDGDHTKDGGPPTATSRARLARSFHVPAP